MHVHTCYSKDCLLSLGDIKKISISRGIDCLMITDHNTIKGAKLLKNNYDEIKIVIGEEIKTSSGEIIGLFLNEKIPPNLTVEETIDMIKAQDGIVYLPHPFDRIKKCRLLVENKNIFKKIDIIEVFNSRTVYSEDNKKAQELAEKYKKIKGYGSDSHTSFEIGKVKIEMKDFNSKKEFLKNLKYCRPLYEKSPIWVLGLSKIIKIFR